MHNPGQIMDSHVIRRRFVFNSLKEGGDAQGRWLAEAFFRGVVSPIKIIKTLSVANRFTCASSATCSYDPSPMSLPFFFSWEAANKSTAIYLGTNRLGAVSRHEL